MSHTQLENGPDSIQTQLVKQRPETYVKHVHQTYSSDGKVNDFDFQQCKFIPITTQLLVILYHVQPSDTASVS